MVFIGNTAIHRTYGRALWFFVKSLTLRTFVWDYIIKLVANRLLNFIGIHLFAIGQNYVPSQRSSFAVFPFICTFINCRVWAFWLASTTIYAFICYNNCHNFLFLLG